MYLNLYQHKINYLKYKLMYQPFFSHQKKFITNINTELIRHYTVKHMDMDASEEEWVNSENH